MRAPPPQNNNIGDGPETVAFGIAALDSYLTDAELSFPTDTQTLRAALGDVEVPYNATGNTMALDVALEHTPKQQFENEQELLNALHPVFEERRQAGGNPFFDRLRSVFSR